VTRRAWRVDLSHKGRGEKDFELMKWTRLFCKTASC
jgi:hypothetical protein